MRFTVTDLRLKITELNNHLTEHNIKWQLVDHARNGYQAVDRYAINPDGTVESGYNVGCGTSREVAQYCYDWVNGEISRYTYVVMHKGKILWSGHDISTLNRFHRDNPGTTFHTFYDNKEIK